MKAVVGDWLVIKGTTTELADRRKLRIDGTTPGRQAGQISVRIVQSRGQAAADRPLGRVTARNYGRRSSQWTRKRARRS